MDSVSNITPNIIFPELVHSQSLNETLRNLAESRILRWETRPGFFPSLLTIALSTAANSPATVVPEDVRLLALIIFKNAVSRAWGVHTHDNVPDEDKTFIHQNVLRLLGETNRPVAENISISIARMAKIDIPNRWTDLIPALMQKMLQGGYPGSHAVTALPGQIIGSSVEFSCALHAFRTMHLVLKELAKKRLVPLRRYMLQIGPDLFRGLFGIFSQNLEALKNAPQPWEQNTDIMIWSLKCMRTILCCAVVDFGDIAEIATFFQVILQYPQLFFHPQNVSNEKQVKLATSAAKCIIAARAEHPIEMIPYLEHLSYAFIQIIYQFSHESSPEKLGRLAVIFLKDVYQDEVYFSEQNEGFADKFFSDDLSVNMVLAIIRNILVYSSQEMESWNESPEEFAREQSQAEWNLDSIRSVAEKLLGCFLNKRKTLISSTILGLAQQLKSDHSPENIIYKDACYRAIGCSSYGLDESVDFLGWFQFDLGPFLVKNNQPKTMGDRMMMARAAWLLGKFSNQLNDEARDLAYRLLIPLISPKNGDLLTSFVVANTMHSLLDSPAFNEKSPIFRAGALQCVESLMELIRRCEDVDSKFDLIYTIALVVERVNFEQPDPILDGISRWIPCLWDVQNSDWKNDGAGNLMQGNIIYLLKKLIEVVGMQCFENASFVQVLFPILKKSIEIGVGENPLLDEGLQLFVVTIQSMDSKHYTTPVPELFPAAMKALSHDLGNLSPCLRLVEEYTVVGQQQFLTTYGEMVAQAICYVAGNVQDRGHLLLADVIEVVIQFADKRVLNLFGPTLTKLLILVFNGSESDQVLAGFLDVLNRLAILNYGVFHSVIHLEYDTTSNTDSRYAQVWLSRSVSQPSELLGWFIDALANEMDYIYTTSKRKKAAVALCAILTQNPMNESVLSRLTIVIDIFVQVLSDIYQEGEDGDGEGDFENFGSKTGEGSDDDDIRDEIKVNITAVEETGQRKRDILSKNDFVAKIDIKQLIGHTIDGMKATLGNDNFSSVLGRVDGSLLNQFQHKLSS